MKCSKQVIDAQNFVVTCEDEDETKTLYCSVQESTSFNAGAAGVSGSKQQQKIVCYSEADLHQAAAKKLGIKNQDIEWVEDESEDEDAYQDNN